MLQKHTLKQLAYLFLFISQPGLCQLNEFMTPNKFNNFILSGNIIWAFETIDTCSVQNTPTVNGKNVVNHITSLALKDSIPAYDLRFWGNAFELFENEDYQKKNKFCNVDLTPEQISFIFSDTLKSLLFHEIYYLDDYKLKCDLVSAAPLGHFSLSSGVGLISQDYFCCADSNKHSQKNIDSSDFILIKTLNKKVDFRYAPKGRTIKQTFGMNMIQSIWYGASLNRIKIFDLSKNKLVPASKATSYVFEDSVKQERYNEKGEVIGFITYSHLPDFKTNIINSVQFTEKIFFNKRSNTFFAEIGDLFFNVRYWVQKKGINVEETGYKILY